MPSASTPSLWSVGLRVCVIVWDYLTWYEKIAVCIRSCCTFGLKMCRFWINYPCELRMNRMKFLHSLEACNDDIHCLLDSIHSPKNAVNSTSSYIVVRHHNTAHYPFGSAVGRWKKLSLGLQWTLRSAISSPISIAVGPPVVSGSGYQHGFRIFAWFMSRSWAGFCGAELGLDQSFALDLTVLQTCGGARRWVQMQAKVIQELPFPELLLTTSLGWRLVNWLDWSVVIDWLIDWLIGKSQHGVQLGEKQVLVPGKLMAPELPRHDHQQTPMNYLLQNFMVGV